MGVLKDIAASIFRVNTSEMWEQTHYTTRCETPTFHTSSKSLLMKLHGVKTYKLHKSVKIIWMCMFLCLWMPKVFRTKLVNKNETRNILNTRFTYFNLKNSDHGVI